MSKISRDDSLFQLEHYDYILPEKLIAQEPSKTREGSRLLVINKMTGQLKDTHFLEIGSELPKNALIIANNSKVVPARILGKRETGSKVEMLLMTPVALLEQSATPIINKNQIDHNEIANKEINNGAINNDKIEKFAIAQVLLKGSKRIKIGETLFFESLSVKVLEKQDFGKHTVELRWKNSLVSELEKYGSIPLPPYIKRPDGPSNYDKDRYQTVYANSIQSGSVAAPTAGLHFTKEIQDKLIEQGFLWEEVTLHVGYGTFSPVRADDIREHSMHAEYVEISEKTSQAILKAKAENRPIITIGTTATRSLEGMARNYHKFKKGEKCEGFTVNSKTQTIPLDLQADMQTDLQTQNINFENKNTRVSDNATKETLLPAFGCSGYTDIFVYPGEKFYVIDGLLTNFHLPKSSLLMLVCAFAGYENTMDAYTYAIDKQYRFFSYGDAMLIRAT